MSSFLHASSLSSLAAMHFDWSSLHKKLAETLAKAAEHPLLLLWGLSGAVIFSIRFVIQWIASERAKKSIIPFGFWECSVLGSFLTLSYFLYIGDLPGILQNLLPFPIYCRNVYLRWTHTKPKHPGNEPRPAE